MAQAVVPQSRDTEQVVALLNTAPQAVRTAWIADKKFTGIAFHPEGYTTLDQSRARFIHRPPGWYLKKKLRECYFFEDQPVTLMLSVHISDLDGKLIDDATPNKSIIEGQ